MKINAIYTNEQVDGYEVCACKFKRTSQTQTTRMQMARGIAEINSDID